MTTGIVVRISPDRVELVSDHLWSLGTQAIEEHWLASGTVELRTSLGDDRSAVRAALANLPSGATWEFVEIDETAADAWRRHARPHRVSSNLVIAPNWVPADDSDSATNVVRIEPGPTFGLGDHPTTSGSLRSIERHLRPGDSVLDVGCGSGVLGIVALTLGAERAHGIDLMPAAVEVSRGNAETNGVSDRWTVSNEPLESIGRPFDVVVANILLPVLIDLAPHLLRLTGRILVVSGLLTGTESRVIDALGSLREVDRVEIDGWTTVTLAR
ncbi:MAG: 50S ribosomal protein L11 methyltransferase [Ilumatobacteraceae bacterium]